MSKSKKNTNEKLGVSEVKDPESGPFKAPLPRLRSESVSSKRSRVSESSDGEDETDFERVKRELERKIYCMRLEIHELMKDERKISKSAGLSLLGKLDWVNDAAIDAYCTIKKYESKDAERRYQDHQRIQELAATRTFADVTAVGTKENRTAPGVKVDKPQRRIVDNLIEIAATKQTNPKHAILIKGDGKTSREIQEKVLEVAKPKFPGLRVRTMKQTKTGVLMEFHSEQDKTKLVKCADLKKCGLKIEKPGELHPRVIVVGVENHVTDEEFLKDIHLRNEITVDSFKVVGKRKNNDPSLRNVVIEGKWSEIKTILDLKKIFAGFKTCGVFWCDMVQRCFNCYAFNHIKKECPIKGSVCRKCGEVGHLIKDCPTKKPSCRNCRNKSKAHNHDVLDSKCPEYTQVLSRTNVRVNFE